MIIISNALTLSTMGSVLRATFSIAVPSVKLLHFDSNYAEVWQDSYKKNTSNCWGKGLAPNRQKVIIGTNDGLVYRCIDLARPRWVKANMRQPTGPSLAGNSMIWSKSLTLNIHYNMIVVFAPRLR